MYGVGPDEYYGYKMPCWATLYLAHRFHAAMTDFCKRSSKDGCLIKSVDFVFLEKWRVLKVV
jgi:hypothetical protein